MKIIGACLINRFYKTHGWTREAVFAMLRRCRGNTPPKPEDIAAVEDRGEYFAVYDRRSEFSSSAIAGHEYEPYSESPCDRDFRGKNRVYEETTCVRPA